MKLAETLNTLNEMEYNVTSENGGSITWKSSWCS